ncbi:MAG: CBS domain-containing protein [Candidatus Nanopelagicales bacterium]|jgi:CBS domain-containing protein|nr:CBS domain-containing protein [Actinomycetota bacterium]NCG01889.1 CBS domain-containing protein [Actinomycetales bacterium]MBT5181952.1 CBS domain-containing protein [Actinomycetota bacterium]MBT5501028.1 CBS domain-containing protein [Actinomycetota bacterium]MBT5807170.1 CBS domain-containing protein [Actinomycetota bacterium]
MLVSTILADKGADVVTVSPEQDVQGLLSLLAQHKVGALVVSPNGTTISGIVSERDIVRALAAGESLMGEPVSRIMTSEVFVSTMHAKIDELMTVMTSQRIRHIPITTDSGELIGIVSIGDLVKARLSELEAEKEALVEYITHGG